MLVTSGSGLLVPQGSLEAAVAAALREYDDDLRLIPQDSDAFGRRIYKVYKSMGNDTPAIFILMWADEHGEPFPLSMQLVEEVKRYDRNSRGNQTLINEDEANAALEKRRRKEAEEHIRNVVDYYEPYVTGRSRHYGVWKRND